MRIGSVCTGIGGLDLGFERAGFDVAWMAEIDPWASRVLEKRWPGVPNVGDWTAQVRSCCWHDALARSFQLEVLVGGIPCQGHSVAGRRGGKDDARNLWPDFAGLVEALHPVAFVIENVPGLLTSNDGDFFAEVLEDCDRLGFSVEWDILSAAYVGAPHRRERVFIVGRRDGRHTWPQREQPTLFPGRPQSWPKAGRWTDGTLYERERQWPTPSAPVAWRTPNARDAEPRGTEHPEKRLAEGHQPGLPDQVEHAANWTTPRAGDSKQGPSSTAKHLASGDLMLTDEVRLWPSPDAGVYNEGEAPSGWLERKDAAQQRHGNGNGFGTPLAMGARVNAENDSGRLSADWTETLMGLPVGWTDPSCDEPEPRPYPWPMACAPGEWPTPTASEGEPAPMKDGVPWWKQSRAARNTNALAQHPLYGASPQAPWEPPRLVEPVKGDGRRHRLRCIGNAVVPACAEVIARSIAASLEREEEHAHAAR